MKRGTPRLELIASCAVAGFLPLLAAYAFLVGNTLNGCLMLFGTAVSAVCIWIGFRR